MTRDLEAALREAREAICRHNLQGAVRIIDAALSAASGEACPTCGRVDEPSCKTVGCPDDASGEASGDECAECGVTAERRKRIGKCVNPKCPARPAPSEAPNVERAMSERDKERAVEALRAVSWIAHLNDDVVRSVADALAAARAEGIAAERERIESYVRVLALTADVRRAVLDAIHDVKP